MRDGIYLKKGEQKVQNLLMGRGNIWSTYGNDEGEELKIKKPGKRDVADNIVRN